MRADTIVILTGAGISKESGLATFRDADGIWARVRIEDVATPEAFARDPARVHAFYNARRRQLPTARPNAAHRALARLQKRWPGEVLLVTQNIDDLHERAGAVAVHMHGELGRARCTHCGAVRRWEGDLSPATPCPSCGAVGGMRPHVVWFGEMPMEMDRIRDTLAACDLFVAIGTSAQVHPAAGFVAEVRGRAATLELNLEPTAASGLFDEARYGPATLLVPAWVDEILHDAG